MSRNASAAVLLAGILLGSGCLEKVTLSFSTPADGEQDTLPFSTRLPGRPSAEHARLFTPRHAPPGSCVVTVIDEPMDKARALVMGALGVAPADVPPPGPWSVQKLEVGDAFGDSGLYDGTRLARLYNGKRSAVVRGPVTREGRVVAAVILISPYPDPDFSRLQPGTLAILFDVAAARR